MLLARLRQELAAAGDPQKAIGQQAYMKSAMPYHGVPTPVARKIFAAVFKVYSTVSGRRFMCDLRDAQERGYVGEAPHYNSVFRVLENPEITAVLKRLVIQSSLPLRSVEVNFACDSSGFSTSVRGNSRIAPSPVAGPVS